MGHAQANGNQWPIDWLSARIVKRIGCFHSDVDFGVATHLPARPNVLSAREKNVVETAQDELSQLAGLVALHDHLKGLEVVVRE